MDGRKRSIVKYAAYVIFDVTNKNLISNGHGEHTSRVRPLEICYETGKPSTSKTPSGLSVQIATACNFKLSFTVDRFETKKEAAIKEQENQAIFGVCGQEDREFYINKRLEMLNWGTRESLMETKPYLSMWLDMISANGDDIKRSFIKQYIQKYPNIQTFLNYKGD